MFSFRPDAESTPPPFVPTPLIAARHAEILEVAEAVDASGIQASEGQPPATPIAPPTPEEIAALEQAAFDRGVESARTEAQALAAICQAMDEAIRAWRAATASLVTKNRRQVLDLCRDLVAHWVGAELVSEPDQYAGYLERALEVVQEDDGIRLFVSEPDLGRLEAHVPEALERWRNAGVSVKTEPALAEASFRIDTAAAAIDGDLESLGDRLRELLDPALSAPAPMGDTDAILSEENAE